MRILGLVCGFIAIGMLAIIMLASSQPQLTTQEKIAEACFSDLSPQDCRLRETMRVINARERDRQADEDRQIGG